MDGWMDPFLASMFYEAQQQGLQNFVRTRNDTCTYIGPMAQLANAWMLG